MMGKRMIALFLAIALAFGGVGTEAIAAGQGTASMAGGAQDAQRPAREGIQRAVTPGDAQKPDTTPDTSKPETWTVTFYFKGGKLPDDGTKTKSSVKVEKGKALDEKLAPVLEKQGYRLSGWKDAAGALYSFDKPVTGSLKLYAYWKAITYKVHFNANGGTGTMKDQSCTYNKDYTLRKNSFKRSGYAFLGWNTRKDGSGLAYTDRQKVKSLSHKQGETIQLYAMWKGNSYRIRYDGNGATSGAMEDSLPTYGKTEPLRKNTFKRKGYTFVGWNTQMDGKGKTYKNGASVKNLTTTKDQVITLYAKWKAVTYTITYKTNKGKLPLTAKKSYKVSTKTFTLPKPTRKNYDFDGWYKDKKFKKRVGGCPFLSDRAMRAAVCPLSPSPTGN